MEADIFFNDLPAKLEKKQKNEEPENLRRLLKKRRRRFLKISKSAQVCHFEERVQSCTLQAKGCRDKVTLHSEMRVWKKKGRCDMSKRDQPELQRRVNPIKELWRNKFLYLLVLPAALYTFIFSYMSLPYIAIAFEKFNYKTGIASPFVGLKNFEYFFQSSWAWTITRNTLVINVLFLIVGTICAVALAIVLNEVHAKRFLKTAQSFMLFPYFISWVIVSYMLQGILGTDNGLFNNIIVSLGGSKINFYSSPQHWYPILLVLNIWKMTGYNAIVYLAAITGIDEGLYEAAYIDGATRWKRIRYITLPLLAPTICILTLMSIGRIFYGDFGMMYAIIRDNSSLMPIAEVIDTYVYRTFKNTGDPSVSMAVGLYQSIVGFILVFTSNWIVRKKFPDGALF